MPAFLKTMVTMPVLLALPMLIPMFYFHQSFPAAEVAGVDINADGEMLIRSESNSTSAITTVDDNQTTGSPQQFMAIPQAATPKTDQKQKKKTTTTNNNNKKRKRKKPIILIGTHHKTGTVLAQKVFGTIAKYARLHFKKDCEPPLSRNNLMHQLRGVDIAIDSHWKLTWQDLQHWSNVTGRPYRFVHFTRHPLAVVVSAYSYHKKGSERWLFDKKKLMFNEGTGPIRSNWCNGWKHRCQTYGEYIPDLCQEDKAAAVDELICHEYDVLEAELRNSSVTTSSTFWDISIYDAFRRLNRLDGVRLQAAASLNELLGMAVAVQGTKNDPNTLTVDLDTVVNSHPLCWSQILSFVGLDPAKYLKRTMKYEISNVKGTHLTRTQYKTDIEAELKKPLVQGAYQPMISIMDQLDMTCRISV